MIRDDTAEPTFVEFLVCADMTDGEWGDGSVQTGEFSGRARAQGLGGESGMARHASGLSTINTDSAIATYSATQPVSLLDPLWPPAWAGHRASASLPACKRYILNRGLPAQSHPCAAHPTVCRHG